ncbi:MAG: GAF domain-containing protein [Calothrix sp. C42_A2020_038]|nr:GAF domain-containing protein [Calothrix sp. C42_A2020_038]
MWTALQEGLLISQTKTCTLFQCDSLQEEYQTSSQDIKKLSLIVSPTKTGEENEVPLCLQEKGVRGLGIPDDIKSQESPKDSFSNRDSSVRNLQIPKYKFIHDRVQQAAYSLIPEDQKKAIHLKIGLLLLKNIPVAEQEDNIFQIVNQFNVAVELITEKKKCDDLAQMNLTAGRKALVSTAYTTALKYLNTGIELLTNDSWERRYNLSLNLFETATEAAYLAGEFEQMEKFVEVVLKQTQTLLEQVKVYEFKIKALGAQNKTLEAFNTALAFLKLLGVEFPEHPTERDLELAMAETASNLKGRSIEELINLPQMTDAKSLAVMCILSSTSNLAYQVAPQLFPFSCLKQINLSIQYGNSPLSCYAYVTYGLMLAGAIGDIQSGYEFGKLGENLLANFNVKEVKTKIIVSFNSVIRHWKEHANCVLKPLLEAYRNGIETGDLEYSAYSLNTYTYCSYFLGRELTVLAREIQTYKYAISEMRQEKVFHWNSIYCQSIFNLLETVENPCCLIGEFYDEEKMLPIQQHANDMMGLLHLYCSKLNLCYLFNEFSQAIENASLAEKYLDAGLGQIVIPIFHFYDSLAHLAVYPQLDEYEQNQILHKVEINQQKIQYWANHAPMNYLHKYYLVEAERYKVLGQFFDAMELYDSAICLARENEYSNEEALANEVAARFYLDLGKDKIAQMYLIDAYYAYSRWGAKAKVQDLAKRYPQLLASILEEEKPSTHPTQQTTSNTKSLSSLSSHQTVIGLKTSISDSLDLAAVIKASQALSGKIELEQLLSTLINIVMENAGASKCALILSKVNNSNLTVTAISTSSKIEFPSTCLESSHDIPITLINYVKRTLEILLVDDVKADRSIADDSYIIREQPKSILCIPIINQAKLIGIIYLENQLTTGAFTRDRLEVLQVLTTQAAISLENAILYKNLADANQKLMEYNHTLEELVETRTQELIDKNQSLQQTLENLKRTQSQLIQSEKMSSLGQMIAGIAHEINNPINFIHGNIQHTNQYIQDLLDLINIYQQECSNPSPAVEEKIEEIDLEFILKDLPKMLDSMKVGTSRIRNIVLSLRNFSRLDEAEMKFIDIHEGIDNTLMILQHRLKKQSERDEITVIKEYGQLPEVNCYAGQLNQVFMNILSNAIDALEEELRNGRTKAPIIKICTEVVNNHKVKIKIADNGCGIPETVKQKIFDPFFTTKPIGSGTGLGLSISYQVIVDKHQGQLICNSTPGEGTEFIVEIPMQM